MKKITFLLLIPVLLLAQTPKERRDNLLKSQDLQSLLIAVNDENAIIRHTAVRLWPNGKTPPLSWWRSSNQRIRSSAAAPCRPSA